MNRPRFLSLGQVHLGDGLLMSLEDRQELSRSDLVALADRICSIRAPGRAPTRINPDAGSSRARAWTSPDCAWTATNAFSCAGIVDLPGTQPHPEPERRESRRVERPARSRTVRPNSPAGGVRWRSSQDDPSNDLANLR